MESRQIKGHTVKYDTSSHNSLGARFIEKMSSSEASELFSQAKNSDHSVDFKDTDDNYNFKLKYISGEGYYQLTFKY